MNAMKLLSFSKFINNPLVSSLPIFGKSYQFLSNRIINSNSFSSFNNSNKTTVSLNLTPPNPLFVPSCGFKVKTKLKRRCKDCYFARIDGKMMILCDSYPRHKQIMKTKRAKYYWILSHCCQSKLRPY